MRIFMSLIYTAELNGESPFDDLVALQRHHEAAAAPAGVDAVVVPGSRGSSQQGIRSTCREGQNPIALHAQASEVESGAR